MLDGADESFLNFLEAADREPPHAGDLPHPPRVRAAVGAGEPLLPVEITSAIELDQATTESLGERSASAPGARSSSTAHVDPDILGGIVLQGRQLDPRRLYSQPTGATAQARCPRSLLGAHMQINPDEITSILKSRIEGLDGGSAELTEVGTVLSVADGIARLHGLENCMSFEMLELPHGVTGLALNLESDNVGAVLFGEWEHIVRGRHRQAHRPPARDPRRRGAARAHRRPARAPARRQGRRSTPPRRRPAEFKAPGVVQRQPVKRTDADRPEGDRRDDPDRPRPARADHRRPPDRQDGDRDRHDHQQQGHGRRLGLRRDRPAHVDRRRARADARRTRRAGEHDHRRRARRRGGADQVHGALRRLRDGRALPLQRQARAVRLRRPHQARLRLPADVAAAAPPAGPRGLPGRRLLPALAAARARGQAQRRARRRLADGAADHRDAGRRRLGLHPDQRDLDHRRADLPRAEAVQLGRAPGDQRRHLGLARRRQRADRRR